MPGPARAGVFIYAKDMNRLAHFYEAIAGTRRVTETAELIVLASADIQLIVHAMPPHIAKDVVISTPPVRREDTALKFFFTVTSLDASRDHAAALGGDVGHENWPGPGFTVCNAMDPEGNVFQLREFLA